MMNSSKDDEEPLPDGWVLCQSKSVPGRIYFFNKKTGKSSWTKPQANEESPSSNKGKKEKSKKEEPEKKNLKRKSDVNHHEDTTPKKRIIRDTPAPEYKTTPKESPKKPPCTPNNSITVPVRNSANKRLQLLRKQISEDAQKEEKLSDATQMKSPDKFKKELKASPKVTQTETQNRSTPKTFNIDLRSPTFNESRSLINRSPSSDSLHSIPSPSQFFAANKILSSMKAQLPEEYCSKIKAKDSFADIDEAICNQTPEYPSTKHPATPPQFSEASKIVSAIKSKLSYKSLANRDNKEVKVFKSAKDRLENLRTSLTNETEDDPKNIGFGFSINEPKKVFRADSVEAMDVDCKETKGSPQTNQYITKGLDNNKENLVLVVDTNIFIHELDVIKNVLNSHIKGYSEQPTLLVPWRVINELDRLKDNNNGNGAICKRAKAAMDYLYQSLPENNRIKGQSLRDANSHIYPCELPDDEILNCSLQQAERGKSVILLSNDKNLCNKAIINGVKSIGLSELKGQLLTKLSESSDPDLHASVKHYEHSVYLLLANILENEMRAKYNTLWQHVLFKAPPWTLRDVLQCLLKHWLAVFNEVFPRIEHLITELKNSLDSVQDKSPKSLTKPEVNNFKELCLEVARKCQIIPEYLELAKLTVERITKKTDLDGNNLCTPQVIGNHLTSPQIIGNHLNSTQVIRNHLNSTQVMGNHVNKEGSGAADDMAVIGAFENVWTVFSSYCAKLATGLEVSHDIEDKITGTEPLAVLTSKWPVFSDQIYDFTNTIKGILNVPESDPTLPEHVSRLEAVFRASLTLISADCSNITRDNLTLFCVKCRNMLQEAYTKFTQLTELLDICRHFMKK